MDDGTREIIGACIEVHRHLGPGLLESVYEEALAHELVFRGLIVQRQVLVPIEYKGIELATPLRLDLLVRRPDAASRQRPVVVEVKSVERLLLVHDAQLLTYLRLARLGIGLLVNFDVPVLRRGIRCLVSEEHQDDV